MYILFVICFVILSNGFAEKNGTNGRQDGSAPLAEIP